MEELESRHHDHPPVVSLDSLEPLPPELGFLQDRFADRASLQKVVHLARAWGAHTDQVLFAMNLVRPDDYYRALALHAGLDFTDLVHHAPNWSIYERVHKRVVETGDIAPIGQGDDGLQIAIAPTGANARRIARLAEQPYLSYQLRQQIFITTPSRIRTAFLERFRSTISRNALRGLEEKYPDSSARSGLTIWQKATGFLILLITAIGCWNAPSSVWICLNVFLVAIFMVVTLFRTSAVFWSALHQRQAQKTHPPPPNSDLPVYTILVPLFREALVLPHLVQALLRLDYPIAKLDIKLILEEEDMATRQMANELNLPSAFDIIVVPPIGPQTKPKALNFALQFARGDFAVIYDAEDRPEPDQLKKAIRAFRDGPSDLVCVQARLSIYNYWHNWLTRQFTIEYAALFDALLPVMEVLRVPLPLGGTSNHFRIDKLREVGAWDSFNVTEDADLGMRLTRLGYRCTMLDSTTYEEACSSLPAWLSQRTRWFKGWLQTLVVHMRHPATTWRELGPHGFFALNILMGGIVLSSVAYPLFLGLIIYGVYTGGVFEFLPVFWSKIYLAANLWNLVAGLVASIALGWFALRSRGLNGWGPFGLSKDLMLIPIYWLLISLAAYRAIWQAVTRPFYWEKTEHGLHRANPLAQHKNGDQT